MRGALRRIAMSSLALALAAPAVAMARAQADSTDPTVIGSVSMGADTMLSASIYDSSGQVVRHLYELAPRSGTVTLHWDGKDDAGDVLPGGHYNWRAVTLRVAGVDEGGVGNGGTAVPGEAYDVTKEPGDPSALAYGPSGDLFVDSFYEEIPGNVYRYSPANLPTGLQTWASKDGFALEGHAIAVDDQYVYVSAHPDNENDGIFRLDEATGKAVGWP